jgi:hypothetical protein
MVTAIQSDLPGIIDHANEYTVGTWLGTGLRYLIMVIVGGAGAAIHPDENHPLKLVQLGIGAPALFASFVVAQPGPRGDVTPSIKQTKSGFFIAANAAEMNESGKTIILSQGFFNDILRGFIGRGPPVPPSVAKGSETDINTLATIASESAGQAEAAAKKAAEDAAAAEARPSPELAEAAKKSAAAASEAARRAAHDLRALNEVIDRMLR